MTQTAPFENLWGLSNPEKIAATPTSTVYKVQFQNQPAILKIYTDLGRSCESNAPYFFKACENAGVARVYEFDNDAMLMEFLHGPQLIDSVKNGKDIEATSIIGDVLLSVHENQHNSDHKFENLEERFRALFRYADTNSPGIVKRAAGLANDLLKNQTDIRLLHGDMHHQNILQQNSRWLAIDPQPLIGDRAYDCANTLHNPHQMPELTENIDRLLMQAKILEQTTGVSSQKIIDYAYIHGCLSACWSENDKTDTFSKSLAIRTSEVLEPHISKNK